MHVKLCTEKFARSFAVEVVKEYFPSRGRGPKKNLIHDLTQFRMDLYMVRICDRDAFAAVDTYIAEQVR